MGDRALIQLTAGGKVSPVLYMHWSGHAVAGVLERLEKRMKDRPDDLDYAFARLVQEAIGDDDGNTGYGVWNAKDGMLTESDSHGDAGCFVVDVSKPKFDIKSFGGYGLRSEDD